MAQWLRALTALPDGPEFNSQQPHGGSQPSVRGDLMPSSGVSEDSEGMLTQDCVHFYDNLAKANSPL